MCGLNICTAGLDNSNISYVSLSFILSPSIYSIIRPESKSINGVFILLRLIINVVFIGE